MNPFLHVVAEANERRLYSQAKWFSKNFYIASGLRDSESQELFCRGQHTSVSFEFQLKVIPLKLFYYQTFFETWPG